MLTTLEAGDQEPWKRDEATEMEDRLNEVEIDEFRRQLNIAPKIGREIMADYKYTQQRLKDAPDIGRHMLKEEIFPSALPRMPFQSTSFNFPSVRYPHLNN